MRASHDTHEAGEWVTTLLTPKRHIVARKPHRQMNRVSVTSAIVYVAVVVGAALCVKFIAGA